ncbi:MFS transporter [Nocardia aurantia]|uniref:Putative MFS-type transporter EfpA n=1 Tax=Nocardia aurantia TaxID=2585199 RepID=A0A7K0DHS6_9NOCA|nr:MFS transporter [Nocardia aurantia]MQY25366.1 putative MFS-type transporter EfpA [Nocardia aurantia]
MVIESKANPLSRHGSGRLLALACAGQFMVILDASVVNVALPSIQWELGFSPGGLTWVVNGYLLAFAGLMLSAGRAVDLFGRRRMFVAGLMLFSASSLVGGLATGAAVLVAARVAQGAGAALLAPATLAVINTGFAAGADRARAFGAWSAAGGAGGMAGAIVGGVITGALSWRWVFPINVPIGAVLIAVAATALPGTPRERRGRLDPIGTITATAGLGALVFGVMRGGEHGWTSGQTLVPIGAGVVLLLGFLTAERYLATSPMMPLRLFGIRRTAAGNAMLLWFGAVPIAMWYFTSLLLQEVLGYDALRSGLGQTPAAVTFVIVARWAALLLTRCGARVPVTIGSGFLLAGFGLLARTHAGSGYLTAVLGPTLLVATGIGLVFPTLMAVATADTPEADAGIAGGLANTASQVGGAVALAALATVASTRTGASGTTAALASGYDLVFLVAAGVAAALAVAGTFLSRHPDR